ncbi:hypothetical protein I551_3930 [Mycobacterium ulcerans str. Harvey]|uniref:Uncharacterized protein n=1 Tax=Mycobacterium ulcerans str. Harvey TaxID=1299332 RepID=A0ABN0QXX5_MYCUL|nr:hypothetical protein I551_3930 [Mycobacterium ulcerans str. Harvey]
MKAPEVCVTDVVPGAERHGVHAVGVAEVSAPEVAETEVSVPQVSAAEVEVADVAATEVGIADVAIAQVDETKVPTTEVEVADVAAAQVQISEVSAAQVERAVVSTAEIPLARVAQASVDGRQVEQRCRGRRRRLTYAGQRRQRLLPRRQPRRGSRGATVIPDHRGHVRGPHLLIRAFGRRDRRRVLTEQIRRHQLHKHVAIGRHRQRMHHRRPCRLKRRRHHLGLPGRPAARAAAALNQLE